MGNDASERQSDGSSRRSNLNDVSAILLADASASPLRKPEEPKAGEDKQIQQKQKELEPQLHLVAKPLPELPDNPLIPKLDYTQQQQQSTGLFRYNLNEKDARYVKESVTRSAPAANGDYTETYYSAQQPDGNFTVTRRKQPDESIKYEVSGQPTSGAITVRKDGTTSLHIVKDSSGRERYIEYGADQKVEREVVLTTDARGTTTEEHSNGARRVRYTDGSTFERTAISDGTGIEFFRDRQGKEIFQESFNSIGKFSDPGPVETKLRELTGKLSEWQKKESEAFIEQFKKRAQTDGISRVEMQLTYRAACDLIGAEGDKPLNKEQRNNLAINILQNAAFPEKISQGHHNTCPGGSNEVENYRRHPALPAMAVCQIGLTGRFKDENGRELAVDSTPHDTSRKAKVNDGERNHASEIYQVLYMKRAIVAAGETSGKRLDYRQIDIKPPGNHCDTGERVVEILPNGQETTLKKSGLFLHEDAAMGKEMLRQLPASVVLGDTVSTSGDKAIAPKTESIMMASSDYGATANSVMFTTEQDFANKLLAYKNSGQLPIRLHINCANQPFRDEALGGWIEPGDSGGHSVTVQDIQVDQAGKVVSAGLDNTWSQRFDKSFPLHQLYSATREVKQNAPELQSQVAANPSDARKRLELIHLYATTRQYTLDQSVGEVKSVINEVTKYGAVTQETRNQILPKIDGMANRLPTHLALDLFRHERNRGLIDDKEYDTRMVTFGRWLERETACKIATQNEKAAEFQQRLLQFQEHLKTLPTERKNALLARIKAA